MADPVATDIHWPIGNRPRLGAPVMRNLAVELAGKLRALGTRYASSVGQALAGRVGQIPAAAQKRSRG